MTHIGKKRREKDYGQKNLLDSVGGAAAAPARAKEKTPPLDPPIDKFNVEPKPPKKAKRQRKANDLFFEWKDPVTDKKYRCSKRYMGILHLLLTGSSNSLRSDKLLNKIGEPFNKGNERHLRKAVNILQKIGYPIFSVRSKEGGYYLAGKNDEDQVRRSIATQRKLANSMLRNAQALEERFQMVLQGTIGKAVELL